MRKSDFDLPVADEAPNSSTLTNYLKSDEFSRVLSRPWRGAYGQRSIAQ